MNLDSRVLRLSKAGSPLDWLSQEQAAVLLVKGLVIWTLGDSMVTLRGGISRAGTRTLLHIPSIIATEGRIHHNDFHVPAVCSRLLFRRDGHLCMYCGQDFGTDQLTCDHIVPRSRGGKDSWTNLVAACRRCNQRKGCRTPEEADMPLLAVPFKPNRMEYLALANRNILADQMQFLRSGFSRHMRLQ